MNLPFLKRTSPPKTPGQAASAGTTPTKQFVQGITTIQDIVAPDAIEVDFSHLKISHKFVRTMFVVGYPRFVTANWLAPLVNFEHSLDIAMFIYPVEGKGVLDDLRRKITEMEAEINSDIQRGKIANIDTQVKLEDARALQEQLAKGAERFYQFGLYLTISADSEEELYHLSKQIQSSLGALLIIAKPASLVMEQAFETTQPLGIDRLNITRNMDTTSLATTFPFTSSELTSNEGIMYGINEHNDSLVIFDRFSLENANMVVFAKSGAGKSYFVKLETLRSLMFDNDVIVIDPEEEYRRMADAVHGQYIEFSFSSPAKINPFDLPHLKQQGEDELSQKLLSLHSLMKIMLGEMNPTQEAILDRALVATYKAKGITPDISTQNNEPPLMEDLYKALIGMEDVNANNLAARLEKFVKGSFRGLFDQRTNVDLNNEFVVFGIKNLEDALRPVAMFMILDFIWIKIKSELKRRLLVVDEAWYLMRNQDSAIFLYSMAKRARKYYLGLTTITQDVEDFIRSDYGKAIVTNSSIQLLMKQSAAAVDVLQEVFYLSEGEKQLLMSAEVGEGLFFAGANHVAIRAIASPDEHRLITSKPQELLEMRKPKVPAASQSPLEPAPMGVTPPTAKATVVSPTSSPPVLREEPHIVLPKESKKEPQREKPTSPPQSPTPPARQNARQNTPVPQYPVSPPPTTFNVTPPTEPLSRPIPNEPGTPPQGPGTKVEPSVEFTSIFENPPKQTGSNS